MSHIVRISPQGEDRCREYAEKVVASYQSGRSDRSRAVQVPGHEIDSNVEMQMLGRLGEVAFVKWLGADPNHVLNWHSYADGGSDVDFAPFFVDVKTSPRFDAKLLIWPSSKTHFYHSTRSNVLALVRSHTEPFSFEVVGWSTKQFFADNHEEPNGRGPQLTAGSWFMRSENLWPPEALRSVIVEASPRFMEDAA